MALATEVFRRRVPLGGLDCEVIVCDAPADEDYVISTLPTIKNVIICSYGVGSAPSTSMPTSPTIDPVEKTVIINDPNGDRTVLLVFGE
jgi:hypothetical protein